MFQKLTISLLLGLLLIGCETSVDSTAETYQLESNNSEIDWLSYTSENFNFSLEYPGAWTVEEDTQDRSYSRSYVFFTSPERIEASKGVEGDQMIKIDGRIKIYENSEDLPNNGENLEFEEWLEAENKYFDGVVEETTVDGEIAYELDGSFIMLEHEGKIYELNFNVPNTDDFVEEREHMLNSFHFLFTEDEEPVATTDSSECNEETCFMDNFKTCESATLSSDLGFAAVTYEILGSKDSGCEVQMLYTKNPNPEWVNQPMNCVLDNGQDFEVAVKPEFEAAIEGKGSCTGPLAEVLQGL